MTEATQKHHFLIAGELVFLQKESEEVNGIRANGILITDDTNIGVSAIGKAQQVLQMNFFKKMGDSSLTIVDVIVMNLMYLGFMTEEEFKKTPPGLQQQEMKQEETTPETVALTPASNDALDTAIADAGIVDEGTEEIDPT